MKLANFIFILMIASYLTGCASSAKMENMIYLGGQKNYSNEIQENLKLAEVSGGKKTNPLWTSEIDNEAFSGAVIQSLESQGLYSEDGQYRLKVDLLKVNQPLFGLDLKVTTHVRYTLTDVTSGELVFDEIVVAPYTASVGDSFMAVKRLRLANEGSAQKNIKGLLEKLSDLRINSRNVSLADSPST